MKNKTDSEKLKEYAIQKYNETVDSVNSGKWFKDHQTQIDEIMERYEAEKERLHITNDIETK